MTCTRKARSIEFCLRRYHEHMQDHKTCAYFGEYAQATRHFDAAMRWSALIRKYTT